MNAPGVLAIWNDRNDAIAELYERWYLGEHLPERLGVPGFIAARRYEALAGSPRFFTHYLVDSPAVLTSPEYLARLAAPSALTREVMANFRNMVRTVCVPGHRTANAALGGHVVVAHVEQPAEVDLEGLDEAAAAIEHDTLVLAVQAWRAVHDPAHAATREAQLRPGGDRRIAAALVVDVMREADGRALLPALRDALQRQVQPPAEVQVNVYRLLGQWLASTAA